MRRQKDFPQYLDIGENRWTVKFCRIIPGHKENILGLCDPSDHTIYIKQGQSSEERFKTLFHEVLHALEDEWKFELPHHLIYKLEDAILQFWRDNFGF